MQEEILEFWFGLPGTAGYGERARRVVPQGPGVRCARSGSGSARQSRLRSRAGSPTGRRRAQRWRASCCSTSSRRNAFRVHIALPSLAMRWRCRSPTRPSPAATMTVAHRRRALVPVLALRARRVAARAAARGRSVPPPARNDRPRASRSHGPSGTPRVIQLLRPLSAPQRDPRTRIDRRGDCAFLAAPGSRF